jgi:hypothetical protein
VQHIPHDIPHPNPVIAEAHKRQSVAEQLGHAAKPYRGSTYPSSAVIPSGEVLRQDLF